MKEYPWFSVSMCVYNGDNPDDFDQSIRSVLDQTVQPKEIVLTVDGPVSSNIEMVIEKYRRELLDSEIDFRVIYLKRNMGHGEARRACFEHCTFDLIALMDADDLSVPKRFEKQLDYFERHPDLSVVGGNIQEFAVTPENCVGSRVVPETDREIKRYMKKRCPMNQVTVMFKQKDVAAVGGYLDWFCEEDYYLWIRLALADYRFGNVPENLVNVRVGEEMYRRRGGAKYFWSEVRIQKYMLKNKLIGIPRFLINVGERFILQVLIPSKLRGFLFPIIARS